MEHPKTEFVLVTPDLAREWLKLNNPSNRNINPQRVRWFVEVITSGRWETTHQGIAFGSDNTLYDGQHRLVAISEAGVAVLMQVTRGLPPSALYAIDTGKSRSLVDVRTITGHSSTRNQTSWLTGLAMFPSNKRGNTDSHTLDAMEVKYEAGYQAACDIFSSHIPRVTRASVVAACIYAWAEDPKKIRAAMEGLRDGTFGAKHPIHSLREWLLRLSRSEETVGGVQLRKVFLRSLDMIAAYLDGVQKATSDVTGARELLLIRRFALVNQDTETLAYINSQEAKPPKAKT